MYIDTVDRRSACATNSCLAARVDGPLTKTPSGIVPLDPDGPAFTGSVFLRRSGPPGKVPRDCWSWLRASLAASLLLFLHSIMESISAFGLGLAMWPRATINWSKAGSTPGPQIWSTWGSGSKGTVTHSVSLSSACAMNYGQVSLLVSYCEVASTNRSKQDV